MTRQDIVALKNLSLVIALLKKVDCKKRETYASLFYRIMNFVVPAEHQPKVRYFIKKFSDSEIGEEAWLNKHKNKMSLIADLENLIQISYQKKSRN